MVADCHMAAFPGSISARLGRSYCSRMLSWYIESERGLLFHIIEGGKVLGYCGGIINRNPGLHGSATSMTQHTFNSLLFNLLLRPWLILHPDIRSKYPLIAKNIRLRFTKNAAKNLEPPLTDNKAFIPSIGLVVIGVLPNYQGKGLGSLLLREFESRALKEGFRKVHLSVRKDNYQAITAYKRNGWVVSNEGPSELDMFKDLG
jgi:GNAT superfamily N-acetyltransferase